MPNQYHFKVTSKAIYEYQDSFCLLEQNLTTEGEKQTDCYVKHLEKVLGCQLPWDKSECKY